MAWWYGCNRFNNNNEDCPYFISLDSFDGLKDAAKKIAAMKKEWGSKKKGKSKKGNRK